MSWAADYGTVSLTLNLARVMPDASPTIDELVNA